MAAQFSGKPLVLIGLDGCEWDLINPWIEAGKLPTLAKITEEGLSAPMTSTIPPLTAPALASFMTGLNPDNTGLTGFTNRQGGLVSYADIQAPTIWDFLGEAGIPSCVVGLRLTYPPKPINGILLSSGLLQPGEEDFVKPDTLADQCRAFLPDFQQYPMLGNAITKGRVDDYTVLTDEIIRLTETQFRIFMELRQSEVFPFSLFYLENTDLLQHFAWHKPEELLRLYQCVDRLLEAFLKAHPDINLLLMSDHGFHAVPKKAFCVNAWLKQQGYFTPGKRNAAFIARKAVRFGKQRVFGLLSRYHQRQLKLLLQKLRKPSSPVKHRAIYELCAPSIMRDARRLHFDTASTTAYAPEIWGIHVADEHLAEQVIQEMKALRDERGNPLVTHIFHKKELYSGTYFTAMPEILFLVQKEYGVDVFHGDAVFTPFKNSKKITGAHDQAYCGVVMAYGNDLTLDQSLETFRIIDFLPTILDYFGIVPSDNIDGTARSSLFRPGSGSKSRGCVTVTPAEKKEERLPYTEEEEAKIVNRLKNLGYM